jgi:phosphatidate cytidylyltransferase
MTGIPGNWGDLRARALSGLAMAAIALGCLAAGGRPWWGLLFIIGLGLAVEWGKLLTGQTDSNGSIILAGSVVVAFAVHAFGWPLAALGVLAAGTLALHAIARKPLLTAGIPCVGAAILALAWLRDDPVAGLANVLFPVLVVISSDIGAYIAGRLFGGRKLAPAISPGKTISGAIGGLVTATLAGMAVAAWASPAGQDGNLARAAILAVLFGIVAQAGDLAESWLKRRVGAKDSSHLIPGHGGLMDRFDALMAVAPLAALLALTLGRGVVLWK